MPGSWAGYGRRDPRKYRSAAERALLDTVRERARHGEPCFKCGHPIDLDAPRNSRWSFTMHHTRSLMSGGTAVCDEGEVFPCHRACNASLGLREQNARRRTTEHRAPTPPPTRQQTIYENDLSDDGPHSQDW
jgi:hypothetical protein